MALIPPLGSCYYPNGVWAQDQYPCDSYSYVSMCCPKGWSCYSNMLCVVTDPSTADSTLPIGTTAQGTCTNPLWSSADCGSFCLDNPSRDTQALLLTSCGNDEYCCNSGADGGSCDCSSGVGTFNAGAGSLQTIISAPGASYTSTPSPTPSSTATSASATTTTTSSTNPASSSTSHSTTTSSSTQSSMTTSSSTSSTASSTSTTSSSTSSSSTSLRTTSSPSSTSSSTTMTSPSSTSSSVSSTSSQTSSSLFVSSTSSSSSAAATNSAIAADAQHTSVTQTTGFKAGIAVAAIVVAAILLGLLFFCCIRWRRRDSTSEVGVHEPPPPVPTHAANNRQPTLPVMTQNPRTPQTDTQTDTVSPIHSSPEFWVSDPRYTRGSSALSPGIASRARQPVSPPVPPPHGMAETSPTIYPEVAYLHQRDPPRMAPIHRQESQARPTTTSPTLRIVNGDPEPPPPRHADPNNEDAVAPLRVYQSSGMMNRTRSSYSPLLGASAPPPPPPLGGSHSMRANNAPRRPTVSYYDGSEDYQ